MYYFITINQVYNIHLRMPNKYVVHKVLFLIIIININLLIANPLNIRDIHQYNYIYTYITNYNKKILNVLLILEEMVF